MKNGISVIEPIRGSLVTKQSLIRALMCDLGGARSSEFPSEIKCNESQHDRWEWFNPDKVSDHDALPEYWRKVWFVYNLPRMKDMRDLRFKYVHAPVDILPSSPSLPCRGIFCMTTTGKNPKSITGRDLIHLGSDIDDEYESEMRNRARLSVA